jgi:adenine-specific DNA-methyltransferase
MMYPRLKLLHQLLAEDGSLWVTIDDNEVHYLKVMLDEVFKRENLVNMVTIDVRAPSAFSTVNPGVFKSSEYVLWYSKNKIKFKENPLRVKRQPDYAYDKWLVNPADHYSQWQLAPIMTAYSNAPQPRSKRPNLLLEHFNQFIVTNAAQICRLASISDTGAGAATIKVKELSLNNPSVVHCLERGNGLDPIYVIAGQQLIFYSKNIIEIEGIPTASSPLTNVWTDIAWEGIANEGGVVFKKSKKPEKLIQRCLEISTRANDLILDAFLGSGTTAAVAHKMGRRWIGIETGDHAITHCIPRLQKVIEGEQGGISQSVNWQGGGGFNFYTLGETIFLDNGHINPKVKFTDLAGYLWHVETGQLGAVQPQRLNKTDKANNPTDHKAATPLLGTHEGIAYYLLYNGILKDRRPESGNVLTPAVWRWLESLSQASGEAVDEHVVYGEATLGMSKTLLAKLGITFKQMPYKIHKI